MEAAFLFPMILVVSSILGIIYQPREGCYQRYTRMRRVRLNVQARLKFGTHPMTPYFVSFRHNL